MEIKEALEEIKKKLKGGDTYSKENHIEKIEVFPRTHSVVDEFEINYEIWGGAENGGLAVPLHVFVSKIGVLASVYKNRNGPEIFLKWEQLDAMRRELEID